MEVARHRIFVDTYPIVQRDKRTGPNASLDRKSGSDGRLVQSMVPQTPGTMRLVLITHTPHYQSPDGWKAYGPYVREMDLWMSGSVQTIIVAPVASVAPEAIHRSYANQNIELHPVPAVSLTGVRAVLHNLWMAPRILWTLYKAMRQADHIHLRCPGNMGLAGSLVQILFPKKPKTAKYAGNWDPKAQQPRSYRFQKWILSNTLISRNMKVLVYGSWSGQSDNVVPFMTASYRRDQIRPFVSRDFSGPLKFLFVGSLSKGKRPDYAVELVNNLKKSGYEVSLDLFGDGVMRQDIQERIDSGAPACLHGNCPLAVKKAPMILG